MIPCRKLLISLAAGAALAGMVAAGGRVVSAEDDDSGGMVTYERGRLSVNARDARSEEVMKELGEKCAIKVVVHGEVFSEVPISVTFQDMPLRKGIERVLRVADITNYLVHFKDTDNGSTVVGLDLIGQKGGERHLTSGAGRAVEPERTPVSRPTGRTAAKEARRQAPDRAEAEAEAKMQENFLKIMDEVLKAQLEDGEEPDPAEVLRLFQEVVPPEMKEQIPPEVLEELEKLQQ